MLFGLRSRIAAAVLGVALLLPVAASASPVVDQSSGQTGNIISQDFPDSAAFSTFSLDDFTLGAAYNLTTLTVFGIETGDSSQDVSVTAKIASTADATAVPLLTVVGSQVGNDLQFNFAGALLGPGSYWLTAYVTRPLSGGQWFWNTRLPITGSNAIVHNPGGGFGLGTSPVPISTFTFTDDEDLAFVLNGNAAAVPEPASLTLIGLGLAGMAARRRRNRTRV